MPGIPILKILVPIDLSESSLNALHTAVSLAKKNRAKLIMLHVVDNILDNHNEDPGYALQQLTGSEDVLAALSGSIQNSDGIMPEIIQSEGNVTDMIIKTAFLQQADLIVMGMHGASGYREGFVGSNTYTVMKMASCHVLSVPVKNRYSEFKKVLFPVRPLTGVLNRYDVVSNFVSPNSQLQILGLSYRKMERETNVLEKLVNEIRDQLVSDQVKVSSTWGAGFNVAIDVMQFTQEAKPELIVVTSVLDMATKPNFIGPYSQKIINCSKVPVLCIKKINVSQLAGRS